MTALYIIAAVLAFLFAVFFLINIHIIIKYGETLCVYIRVLFLRINIYPPKKKKQAKKFKKKATPKAGRTAEQKPKKSFFSKGDTLETLGMIAEWLGRLFETLSRKLGIRVKRFDISVGTEDAAQTAVLYGAITSASSVIFRLLAENSRFALSRGARVRADFASEKTSADIKLDIFINISGIIALLRTIPKKLLRQVLSNEKSENETK